MQNETIMDKATQYTKDKEQVRELISTINYVRIYKKLYLVYKLLYMKGTIPTKYYYNTNEISSYKQKFNFNK